ncbi:DUF423 domain-containing protein [Membranihabitans marinus]|uniref:DUF423 domain-containing protein n=1 Tax=Membranihabitans marinus TaxID=1227546 RepID=UPI001F21AF07|nr:DUF423 domain-containing protein [Membranihabitans marinus]
MYIKAIITFIMGGLAVIIGAFGAHALDKHFDDYGKAIFETGSRYHFYHVFLMIVILNIGYIVPSDHSKFIDYAWNAAFIGILLFSGSLYLLATQSLHGIPSKILGPITPIGGLFLILGWIFVVVYLVKVKLGN